MDSKLKPEIHHPSRFSLATTIIFMIFGILFIGVTGFLLLSDAFAPPANNEINIPNGVYRPDCEKRTTLNENKRYYVCEMSSLKLKQLAEYKYCLEQLPSERTNSFQLYGLTEESEVRVWQFFTEDYKSGIEVKQVTISPDCSRIDIYDFPENVKDSFSSARMVYLKNNGGKFLEKSQNARNIIFDFETGKTTQLAGGSYSLIFADNKFMVFLLQESEKSSKATILVYSIEMLDFRNRAEIEPKEDYDSVGDIKVKSIINGQVLINYNQYSNNSPKSEEIILD